MRSVQIQSSHSGSLAGRLTDLDSRPLAGVTVVLHNETTGAEARTVTSRNGGFRFVRIDAGEYTLTADSPRLGHGRLEGILVTGGVETRVQAAVHFERAATPLVEAATPGKAAAPQEAKTAMPVLAPVSRAALNTERPEVPARLTPHRLRAMTAVPRGMTPSQSRAGLETQSVAITPALAATPQQAIPLPSRSTPVPATNLTASSGKNAAPVPIPPVAAAAQETDPAAAAATATLTAAQLHALPAAGRNWQEFLLNTPASSASAGASQETYRSSQESAEVTVDGANKSLKFGVMAGSETESSSQGRISQGADLQESVSQSMSQSWNGRRGFGLSETAVRKVTATAGNVEAAGVRTAGGRTGIETEHGGNALHGQGSYFDRQNSWGARNPFTQWLQQS